MTNRPTTNRPTTNDTRHVSQHSPVCRLAFTTEVSQ